MADIELKCPVCSRNVTVSEFADPEAIFCRACGQKLELPTVRTNAKAKPMLKTPTRTEPAAPAPAAQPAKPARLKKKGKPEPEQEQEGGQSQEWRFLTHTRKQKKPEKKFRISPSVISWLIFAVLANVMFFLRYRNVLPKDYYIQIPIYSPFVAIAFHILIMLKAFRDSVFHGIICFLFPPYSLYYLFLVCDDFYLRGVFGGVLVAIGQDSFIFFREVAMKWISAVNHFIQGGAFDPF